MDEALFQQRVLDIFRMSPVALLEPVSPDCCVEDCVYTEKARRDINYPYLKPIKHASSEQLSAVDGRLSPDIPLHAPVPVRGIYCCSLLFFY